MTTTRTLILSLFLLASLAFSQSLGFAGVRFGFTQQQVVEELFRQGYEPIEQAATGRIIIPTYQYGELPVEIAFLFNKAGRCYGTEIRTGRVESARYPKVLEAARYMSEQLAKTYGQPVRRLSPRIEEIRNGFRAFYWEWNHSDHQVYTSITSLDNRYFCVGTVVNKSLAMVK